MLHCWFYLVSLVKSGTRLVHGARTLGCDCWLSPMWLGQWSGSILRCQSQSVLLTSVWMWDQIRQYVWKGIVNWQVNANPDLLKCGLGPALPLGSSKLAPLCSCRFFLLPGIPPSLPSSSPSKCSSALKAKVKGKFWEKTSPTSLPELTFSCQCVFIQLCFSFSFLSFFFFWPHCVACENLSSLTRDRTHAPCSGSTES